jgi:hypothetical protein
LDVDDDSPDCPNGCKATPILNIPDSITCFTHFALNDDFTSQETATKSFDTASVEENWIFIPKGKKVKYIIMLMKDGEDWQDAYSDGCKIKKESEPCIETPAEPCYPDCPNDKFTKEKTRTDRIQLTDCGN